MTEKPNSWLKQVKARPGPKPQRPEILVHQPLFHCKTQVQAQYRNLEKEDAITFLSPEENHFENLTDDAIDTFLSEGAWQVDGNPALHFRD